MAATLRERVDALEAENRALREREERLQGVLEGTEKPEKLLDKKKLEETGKGILKGILNQ